MIARIRPLFANPVTNRNSYASLTIRLFTDDCMIYRIIFTEHDS